MACDDWSGGNERWVEFGRKHRALGMVLRVALEDCSIGVEVDFSARDIIDDEASDLGTVCVADGR